MPTPRQTGSRSCRPLLGAALAAGLVPWQAFAGMPILVYSDTFGLRRDTFLFFVLGFFILALLVQRLWNSLSRDFTKLPKIRYRSAVGLLMLSGLVFYLLLTMISGARELMTPGAWVRDGYTYRLSMAKQQPEAWFDSARQRSIEGLRDLLWQWVARHGNQFPPDMFVEDIPISLWKSTSPNGEFFLYRNPGDQRSPDHVVLLEPPSFDKARLAVMANGEVRRLERNSPLLQDFP